MTGHDGGSRPRRPEALRGLLEDDAAVSELIVGGEPVPDEAARRLARLRLLHGLPFAVLVPDARMLPPESMRFFFLDDNWLDALVDGALDAVVRPGPSASLLRVLRPHLTDAVAAALTEDRARRRGRPPNPGGPTADPSVTVTGFLLRSAAVADWPGLRVTGYATADGGDRIEPLRLDRPAPTVMLALFERVLARVDLATPVQDPGFGIRPDSGRPGGGHVVLRGLGGEFRSGYELPGGESVPVPMRAGTGQRAVVDVAALQREIAGALARRYAPQPAPPLRAAGLALHLIDGGSIQILAGPPGDETEA